MTLKIDEKFEEKLVCCFKNESLESLKMCTFIGSYCAKHLTFDLKKYRRVIFHDTEE